MRKMLLASLFMTLLVGYLSPPMNTQETWSGEVVMALSGPCPAGWTESSALNGSFPRGTINANADVGGTGGVDSVTPAGTVSTPTFSGAQGTTSAVSAGTPAGTNSTASWTIATGGYAASTTHYSPDSFGGSALASGTTSITVPAETFTGSALATHTHTLTPSGTVSTPTFSGSSFDNRPAFVKVIFCVKN